MGTTLTGTTPQDTYDSLIKVTDNGPLSGTLKALSDGLGNDSTLSLSTTAASIAGTLAVTGVSTFNGLPTVNLAADNTTVGIFHTGGGSANKGLKISTFAAVNDNAGVTLDAQTSTGVLAFATVSTERMRITSAGLVGIGTSTPVAKLESLDGDIKVTTQSEFAGFVTSRNLIPSSTGTQIGRLQYSAYRTGATYVDSAAIQAFATEAWSASSTPSWLSLQTVASGSTSLVERVRVDSDGLKFNSDTAAANALDDYEEGTWTPVLRGASTAGTYEQATTFANYTKIGRQVSANVIIVLAASVTGGGIGYAQITGLPFAKSASQQIVGASKFNLVDFGATTSYVTCEFISASSGTDIIYFTQIVDNGLPVDLPISAFGNNSLVAVSLTYYV